MSEKTSAKNPTKDETPKVTLVLQTGPAPAAAESNRSTTGMSAIIKDMKVGGWFRINRKDGKVDNSKRYQVKKTAQKHGIKVEIYAEAGDPNHDIVKRIE